MGYAGANYAAIMAEAAKRDKERKAEPAPTDKRIRKMYLKSEVAYERPATGTDHCKQCVHFISPKSCETVTGTIRPEDWCNRFTAVRGRSAS